MDQPFKFRFVNEITGVFVLLCAAAMIVGVFLAGRAQGLFEPKLTLRTLLSAKEGSFGLREGTEVRILDTAAGTVKPSRTMKIPGTSSRPSRAAQAATAGRLPALW